jgi:hypothetical protein
MRIGDFSRSRPSNLPFQQDLHPFGASSFPIELVKRVDLPLFELSKDYATTGDSFLAERNPKGDSMLSRLRLSPDIPMFQYRFPADVLS